jgi:hypothetical protein
MPMTQMKLELAEKLDRLDPGSFLPISPTLLEEVFGSGRPVEVLMQAGASDDYTDAYPAALR